MCSLYAFYLASSFFLALLADLGSKTWCMGVGVRVASVGTLLSHNALFNTIVLQFLWKEVILHARRSEEAFVSHTHSCSVQKEGLPQTVGRHFLTKCS